MSLCRRIAAGIALLGLKTREVSERTGKAEDHIRGVTSGALRPSPELMAFLSESGIDANWLLTGQGSPYAADSPIAAEEEPGYESNPHEKSNGFPVPKTDEQSCKSW